jgi:hypothetical protein
LKSTNLRILCIFADIAHRSVVMIKALKALLGKSSREHRANPVKPIADFKGPNRTGDFRAVEIAPSVMCCSAAKQVTGRSYLRSKAPRLPLMGCTMPTNCSCGFRKNADRRDGDRRLIGATATTRWFAGTDGLKLEGRRSADGAG